MKVVVVLAVCIAVAVAYPYPADMPAEILRSESDVHEKSYKFAVETSDGKVHEEQGEIQNLGAENEAISVHGMYKYVGDDGKTYEVTYTADERGFQPVGEHIPQPA